MEFGCLYPHFSSSESHLKELASAFVCNELFAASLTELCGQNNTVDIDDLVDVLIRFNLCASFNLFLGASY
jgi:hypothetical protein